MRFPHHSFVQVTQEFSYDYGPGEPPCILAAGYEGQVVQTDENENVLVRFNARDPSGEPIGDRWVLQEDLLNLRPLVDTSMDSNAVDFDAGAANDTTVRFNARDPSGERIGDQMRPLVDTSRAPYEDHGVHSAGMTTQAQMQPPPEPAPRLTNPSQLAPIFFVLCTVVFLYSGYVYGHCVRLMQLNETPKMVNQEDRFRGYLCFAICSFATLMIVISYLRAIFTHPGTIPTEGPDAPYWEYHADIDKAKKFVPKFLEKKARDGNGERRYCKWCKKFKPDRCHHCKVCGMCILKMDHHCPWIYNCVGFHNYKYFFLLLLYAVIDTHLIVWTMSDSVAWYVEDGASFRRTFMALFCVTLAASLSIILTLFWLFHVWLMFKGLTTIEFCEKRTKTKDPKEATFCELIFGDVYRSNFDRSPLGNVRAVLGDWTILWLLPVCPPSGSGLFFAGQEEIEPEYGAVNQARSMETQRGLYVRRSANKKRDKHKQRESSWV